MAKNLVVYIAGPYRAPTLAGVFANIQRARLVAQELAKHGIFFFCPHLNSAFMDGLNDDNYFLDFGLEMLRRCDAVLVLEGSEYSTGTKGEIAQAHQEGPPVFFMRTPTHLPDALLEWLAKEIAKGE